jgi:hypothetical protein
MKNINNSIPFYKMHRDIMLKLRLIAIDRINFSMVFKGQRFTRPLNELVDQLHSLNRII